MSARRKSNRSTRSAAQAASTRKLMVLGGLLGALTITSVLLLLVSPPPLTPDASSTLFAIDNTQTLDSIFQTRTPTQEGRWKHIYVHHSRTPAGNAMSLGQISGSGGLGDHFVIGNGDGCVDGEIQVGQRWNQQQAALPPAGARSIDPDFVSICLVGDFDRGVPTPTQLRRVVQLIGTLQSRLNVSADRVIFVDQPDSPAGIGRYFPTDAVREQLLP